MTPESIEAVVIGAGPAGLRAAQVLAEAGREVVVLEKNAEIGPKTCAGGLTLKTVRELAMLARPDHEGKFGLPLLTHVSFRGEPLVPLDPEIAMVHTISRRGLGEWQAGITERAGAELRTGVAANRLDFSARTLVAGGRTIRYRHLIGADGTASAVRRALGLTGGRDFFAGEFNIPGLRRECLYAACAGRELAGGYFWVFPHADYTSVGAMVHKGCVPPARVRPYLERRMAELGIEPGDTPYEGATIGTDYFGVEFQGSVYLAGDAAGTASALSGEGIYGALISGEAVALSILEPGYPRPKLRSWLRSKGVQDATSRLWQRALPRRASFLALSILCRGAMTRRWISELLLRP
jgi:geranylgeranyl reductase